MQEIYSPFKKGDAKPNRIIDILTMVRPQLDRLSLLFMCGRYQEAIDVYEHLLLKYDHLETDMSKIAFAYYQLGRYDKAEAFIRDLFEADCAGMEDILLLCRIHLRTGAFEKASALCDDMWAAYHSPELALVKAEISNHLGNAHDEFYAYTAVLRYAHPENTNLRLKAFAELARLSGDAEEGEYYLYQCFSMLGSDDLATPEFANAMNLASDGLNHLVSPRIRTLLITHNEKYEQWIRNAYQAQYQKVCGELATESIIDVASDWIDQRMGAIDKLRQDFQLKGDYILRSLNEHLVEQQPTFAYAFR